MAALAHSALGVLVICLPTGLLFLALLRRLRAVLTALLPQPHRGAVSNCPQWSAKRVRRGLAGVALGVAIGAATHVVWDSFTHRFGPAVQRLPLLQRELFRVQVYTLLQHLSTVFGVVCLLVAYARTLRRLAGGEAAVAEGSDGARYLLLAMCFTVALLAAVVPALAAGAAGVGVPPGALYALVIRTVIRATSAFSVLFVATAIGWSTWHRGSSAAGAVER